MSKFIKSAIAVLSMIIIFNGLTLSGVLAQEGSISDILLGEKLDEAREIGLPGSEENINPLDRVVILIRVVLGSVAVIFLILILYGGFRWMMSGGNEENITKAKKILSAAAIGLVIIFLSYSITLFIFNVVFESRRYV